MQVACVVEYVNSIKLLELSFWPPLLDAVVGIVSDKYGAVVRDGHRDRLVELAGARADFAEAGKVASVRRELLHAIVVEVGDKDVAMRADRDRLRNSRSWCAETRTATF